MNRKHLTVLFLMAMIVFACKKSNPFVDKIETFLGFQKPSNFPEPVYNFAANPITKEGFELGRMIFNEPR
ncbi:MAG: cytochrome-c peroxidase, partial [Pedobacter sp.]